MLKQKECPNAQLKTFEGKQRDKLRNLYKVLIKYTRVILQNTILNAIVVHHNMSEHDTGWEECSSN